jgi:hypothetical protein
MSVLEPFADMASVAVISSSQNRMRASDDCPIDMFNPAGHTPYHRRIKLPLHPTFSAT